jgi:hypothetical protein
LQLDETTDVSGKSQLISSERFVVETQIIPPLSFCRELETTTTTGSDILTHSILILKTIISNVTTSPRNGNPEEPVYFLKAKQGYTVSKFKKVIDYILISAGMIFRNRKFRYGIPAYTGPFRALVTTVYQPTLTWSGDDWAIQMFLSLPPKRESNNSSLLFKSR